MKDIGASGNSKERIKITALTAATAGGVTEEDLARQERTAEAQITRLPTPDPTKQKYSKRSIKQAKRRNQTHPR